MKRLLFIPIAALLLMSACTSEEKIQLLNGENLDNWSVFLPDSIDPETIFRMENGNLFVGGIPNGYIRTKESYSSYKLHVEWRWLEEPKNSGVLLHTTGEDLIWPNCIEAQIMAGNAGDFVLIGKGAGITVDNKPYLVESEENRYSVIPKIEDSSEFAQGEWNSYDITVTESEIELVVNDVVQNRGKNPTKKEGNICIQSEGGPMEFRNIYLIPLK